MAKSGTREHTKNMKMTHKNAKAIVTSFMKSGVWLTCILFMLTPPFITIIITVNFEEVNKKTLSYENFSHSIFDDNSKMLWCFH